ncbi:alanine--glyoxylate aminotransferase family protein, partial [Vibrio metschnikovii]|nr:alanine--glyoxylate aminotransferase family protein [Vibrio metschnikovii]
YNLEIGAGLGALAGKAWRIGLMGYAARPENIALCLKALQDGLALQR